MNHKDFKNLDDFIDTALKEERMQSVPFGFHRNVENNLKVAAEILQERNQYRFLMILGVTAYTLIFGTATLYMILGGIANALTETAPGFFNFSVQLLQYLEVWWYQSVIFMALLPPSVSLSLSPLSVSPSSISNTL